MAGESPATAVPLDPAGLRVSDTAGSALETLLPGAPPGAGEVADPLRVLLGVPPQELSPGDELQVVVWGPRPRESVRLATQHPGLGELELEPVLVDTASLPEGLASLAAGSRRRAGPAPEAR